ncbi:hypothetical protein [Peijinzhouia sedimentorum]
MENNQLENQKLKRTPFEVPEGYFDDLPMRINDKIIGAAKPKPSFVFSPSVAFATSLLTIVLVAVLWFKPFTSTTDLSDYEQYDDQLYWTIMTSNLSIDEFFNEQELSPTILDQIIVDEIGYVASQEYDDFDPNWDF